MMKNTKDISSKRTSSRVRTLSSAMRLVDEDTRRDVHLKRLALLEADNFVEEEEVAASKEDAYGESDEEQNTSKKKRHKGGSSASSHSKNRWLGKRVKSLERMILEQGYESLQPTRGKQESTDSLLYPNYVSIAAEPSKLPARNFCSVCGSFGKYCCVRCGSRFCSIRCNENHKETRCMKFSL